MANSRLSPDQVQILMNEGTFRGLKKLLQNNQITEEQARGVLTRSYETLLGQVKEARRELQRVQNALHKLENLFTIGKQSKKPFASDQTHVEVGVTLMAFDGWVVSLMETNLTITGMLNPAVTRTKIKEFGTAMNTLMDKRAAKNHPAFKDDELFDGYVNNWRTAANKVTVK
jgi:hypothetical protein